MLADNVSQAVQGCHSAGALSSLKHFPGHGSTSGDTHRLIPKVDKSLKELMLTDLLPFKAGIDAGVDMVMTAHICYPQIDADNPATLSKTILQDLLRNQLKFNDVILSDSMNMGAIRRFYDPAESTILALKAGIDIIMLSEEHYDHSGDYLTKQIASLEAVKEAVIKGQISEQEINEKLLRILTMKLNKMIIKDPEKENLEDIQTILSLLDEIRKFGSSEQKEELSQEMKDGYLIELNKLHDKIQGPIITLCFEIIEKNLEELAAPTSSFSRLYQVLVPSEIQVAEFIRKGKTSKDIADALDIAQKTVENHRNKVRDKLGLRNKGANLRSYLMQLDN